MKIKPQEKVKQVNNAENDLSPLDKKTRRLAILLAFAGVFTWAVRILFF